MKPIEIRKLKWPKKKATVNFSGMIGPGNFKQRAAQYMVKKRGRAEEDTDLKQCDGHGCL